MTEPTQDPDKDVPPASADADADWADALAEQAAGPAKSTQADGLQNQADETPADDWASALAEQTAAGSVSPAQAPADSQLPPVSPASAADVPTPSPQPHIFEPLVDASVDASSDIDMIMDIPVQLSVELGRTRLTIKNILQLGQGSIVELDGLAGEPMDIFVNGYLIAQGEVVVVDEKYGIRLTDIITPSDRLSRLNGRR